MPIDSPLRDQEGSLCYTAIGMVYPAMQVHGKSVLQGHAKVHVDSVEADYKDYLLPVPTEEFSKLGQTLLSFIQWPKKYIELTKASNETRNKKIVASNTSAQIGTKQIIAADTSTQTATKQIVPTLPREEGPSNHRVAVAPTKDSTKSARPINSIPWNDKKPFSTKELDDIVSSCISVCGI